MKSISILLIVYLVIVLTGCSGGSSRSIMAMTPMEPIEPMVPEEPIEPEEPMAPTVRPPSPPPRPVENAEARRVADGVRLGTLTLIDENSPFEGYVIEGGVLTDNTPGKTTDNPVKSTTGIIGISGWQEAMYTRIPDPQDDLFEDRFYIYTNAGSETDYLDFGYWIREEVITGDPDTLRYSIASFVFGATPSTTVLDVEGSATYSGPATGIYAKKSGTIFTSSGQFKADVALQATFGLTAMGVDLSTISGTVSNFTDINDNLIDSTWAVDLNEARHDPKDVTPGLFEPGTTTDVGGVGAGGRWDYQYYGALDDTDPTVQPGFVGGTFSADFANGEVTGAFAATKD